MKIVSVNMPQMGQSAAEGTVVKWIKNVGDAVQVDEILVEVESDKINIEVGSPVSGRLTEIVDVGETLPVGDVIAKIETDEPDEKPQPKPHAADADDQQVLVSTASMPSGIDVHDLPEVTRDWLSPSVMRLALLNDVTAAELKTVSGSGENGRMTKDDLLAYLRTRSTATPASQSQQQASTDPGSEVVPMTTIRRTIADHMVQSIHTSAHVTMVHAVDMTHLVELRGRIKEAFLQKHGARITYTGTITYATARVLSEFPTINASVQGTNILLRKQINVGCAVALPDESLVVPVVKDADKKTFPEIAADLDRLIALARSKSLTREDVDDGTFTISNFGACGSLMGTPIINQPQVAILGMGAVFQAPVVVDGEISIRDTMYLNFSFDHRVIDGAMGGRFLNAIQRSVESLDEVALDVAALA